MLKMLKHNITKRKFYGKWLFKTSLHLPGVAVMRMHSLPDVIKFLQIPHTEESLKYNYHRKAYANRTDLIALCSYLLSLNPTEWFKRIEVNNLDIYTNNNAIYDHIILNFPHILSSISEPDINRVDEYDDSHHIICKKFPHDRYRYKIYLKPHRMKNDKSAKHDYVQWLDGQNNVLISQAVKDWFIRTDWNWDRRYILVEDHKTLLFLHMRNAEVLGKVYEYILADK